MDNGMFALSDSEKEKHGRATMKGYQVWRKNLTEVRTILVDSSVINKAIKGMKTEEALRPSGVTSEMHKIYCRVCYSGRCNPQ